MTVCLQGTSLFSTKKHHFCNQTKVTKRMSSFDFFKWYQSLKSICSDHLQNDELLIHGFMHRIAQQYNAPSQIIIVVLCFFMGLSYSDGTYFHRIRLTISAAFKMVKQNMHDPMVAEKARVSICDLTHILQLKGKLFWDQEALEMLFRPRIVGI